MTALFAIATRGLEAIAAQELAGLAPIHDLQTGYRRIAFSSDAPLGAWLAARTVDDCFLHLATWRGVSHRREALADCAGRSAGLALREAAAGVGTVRRLPGRPRFSVTVNFVGRRNYSGDELKLALGAAMARSTSWRCSERDDQSDLNVRVFIEHDVAHLGVRLAAQPLHERAYKQGHIPGSLRPPVAAAMLAISGARAGEQLLDPCCGAGTILVEARYRGVHAIGGDRSLTALAAARANLSAAGHQAQVSRWELAALPLADASVERVVANLPWDRQVAVDGALVDFHRQALGEINRVLTPRGSATVLTAHPELIQLPGRRIGSCLEISVHGQTPSIVHLHE